MSGWIFLMSGEGWGDLQLRFRFEQDKLRLELYGADHEFLGGKVLDRARAGALSAWDASRSGSVMIERWRYPMNEPMPAEHVQLDSPLEYGQPCLVIGRPTARTIRPN